MSSGRWSVEDALAVSHPDPVLQVRAANVLIVIYAFVLTGVVALWPLSRIPNGTMVASVALAATFVFVASAYLVRTGRYTLGVTIFFTAFLLAFLAVPLIGHDARLSAVYCAMPVGVAGVTLGRRGVALVTAAAISIALVGTTLYPPVDPPPGGSEIVTAALLLILVSLVTSLLGQYGQRLETRRADDAAQESAKLARRLTEANAELEKRVMERTEELQHALSRQESLVAQMAELSLRDPLTGLYNRRHADYELPRLLAAADRYGHPLAMAMADIDHFKLINDGHSYSVGDEVLRRFARIITTTARSTDVITRYGGEEFLLVMPQTSLEQAHALCERLRTEVAGHPWHEIAPDLEVTVSIGVSDSVQYAGLVTLVAASDAALHRAKRGGRNRVELATSTSGHPDSGPLAQA